MGTRVWSRQHFAAHAQPESLPELAASTDYQKDLKTAPTPRRRPL
jgi:hypothetical protein